LHSLSAAQCTLSLPPFENTWSTCGRRECCVPPQKLGLDDSTSVISLSHLQELRMLFPIHRQLRNTQRQAQCCQHSPAQRGCKHQGHHALLSPPSAHYANNRYTNHPLHNPNQITRMYDDPRTRHSNQDTRRRNNHKTRLLTQTYSAPFTNPSVARSQKSSSWLSLHIKYCTTLG